MADSFRGLTVKRNKTLARPVYDRKRIKFILGHYANRLMLLPVSSPKARKSKIIDILEDVWRQGARDATSIFSSGDFS